MIYRVSVVGLCAALLVGTAACSSSGDDALAAATKTCNETLALATHQGFRAMVRNQQKDADLAAEAASKDPKWHGLALAMSDLASTSKSIQTLEPDLRSGDDFAYQQLSKLTDKFTTAKTRFVGQCRLVKAAGGKVSQSRLDSFIK